MKPNLTKNTALFSIPFIVVMLVYEKQWICLGFYLLFLLLVKIGLRNKDIPKSLQKRLDSFKH